MIETDKAKIKVEKLAKKHKLLLVVLFGSQVSGKTHSNSDTDIAFFSEKRMSLKDIAQMQMDFVQTLKMKKIDLVALNGAHPLLLKQVAVKGKLLYEKEPSAFARFKIYALKRFMEAKPLLELRNSSLKKFIQKYD